MHRQTHSPKAARWLELLRVWQQSGLSIRVFCRRRRLSEPCFYAWRRLLRQRGLFGEGPQEPALSQPFSKATTPAFVKIAVEATAAAQSTIELVVADKRVLRVRPGFDADLLRQLLHILEEPSC